MNLPLFDAWRVRSLDSGDVNSIAQYADNFNVWINLRDLFPHPYSTQDAKNWLKVVRQQDPEQTWGIASASEVIGGIGIHVQQDVHRYSAELGYWLGEPFWGKGIATAAVNAVVRHVFTKFDVTRIFAGVFAYNAASARVLEKAGFTREGVMRQAVVKNGKTVDQFLYAILRDEWRANKR
ncbi:MAG: GNAT family N-acetyltransferase [Ignavibacteriae bacterium]|nr:GNAT family N-acetyltransferase [Ignavibacteriota bacterium]